MSLSPDVIGPLKNVILPPHICMELNIKNNKYRVRATAFDNAKEMMEELYAMNNSMEEKPLKGVVKMLERTCLVDTTTGKSLGFMQKCMHKLCSGDFDFVCNSPKRVREEEEKEETPSKMPRSSSSDSCISHSSSDAETVQVEGLEDKMRRIFKTVDGPLHGMVQPSKYFEPLEMALFEEEICCKQGVPALVKVNGRMVETGTLDLLIREKGKFIAVNVAPGKRRQDWVDEMISTINVVRESGQQVDGALFFFLDEEEDKCVVVDFDARP